MIEHGVHIAAARLADTVSVERALRDAERTGCEWLSLARDGERLTQDAPGLAAPALQLFDAVFGAVGVAGAKGVWRPSRLAFDEPERLPHALLNWWVGEPRFVRAATLSRLIETAPANEGGIARLMRLWREARCIKLAAPLVEAGREPEGLQAGERDAVLRQLAAEPVLLSIPYGERTYRLPYTGLNAGIEREQTRGLFFEAAELEWLKRRIGPGAVVVDVGANTGNHTVFFAGPMRAAAVLPFEPLPDAAHALRLAVRANDLRNVDLAHLGVGVAARSGRARVVRSAGGGLGATRLEADPAGEVPVVRLDDCLTRAPTFLKIDVEGMELDVLAGAPETIRTARPLIFIEVANANTGRFLDWLALAKYRIERIFSDKGHANYLIAPFG